MVLDINHGSPTRGKWVYSAPLALSPTSIYHLIGKKILTCECSCFRAYVLLNVNSVKYLRQLAFDGNFSQAHLAQKFPRDDVWLTDGELFMVARSRYRSHLKVAIEIKEVRNALHCYTNIYQTLSVEANMS